MDKKHSILSEKIAALAGSFGGLFRQVREGDAAGSKKELMGEMMGDVVHQWRQPLNIIKMSNSIVAMMCKQGKFDPVEVAEYTAEIGRQVDLMSETLETFRDFFLDKPMATYNVWKKAAETVRLVEGIYSSQGVDIVFRRDLMGNFEVMGYENELKQALINILNNARDVIEERGPRNRSIEVLVTVVRGKVIVKIKDFAGGIPQEALPKVFNPGFTTKSKSNGMGIGLDMTKKMIEKCGGSIFVANWTNGQDKGAVFSVVLPRGE